MQTAPKERKLERGQLLDSAAADAQVHSSRVNRATPFLFAILLILPVLLCVCFVVRNFVEAPIEDDMYFFITLKNYLSGKLSVSQVLMHQMLEHRCGVLLVLLYAIGKPFSFQGIAWVVSGLVFLSATAVLLTLRARAYIENTSQLLWLLPITWLLFSVRQWETLLWGFCVDLPWNLLLVVTTLLALERSRRFDWYFAAACACAVLGAFSHAAAMIVFPIGVVLLLLPDQARTRCSKLVNCSIWIALAVSLWAGSHGVHSGHGDSISLASLKHYLPDLSFLWVACLGNPLGCEPKPAFAAGVVLLGLFTYCFWTMMRLGKMAFRICAFPLSLCVYWLLTAGCIAYGRYGAGVEVACLSRYCTNLTAGVIGVYLFCLALRSCGCTHFKLLSALMLGLIVPSLLTAALVGHAVGERLHDDRLVNRNIIQNHGLQSEAIFRRISFNQQQYDPDLFKFMDEQRIGLFAQANPPSKELIGKPPIPNYLLEEVNSEPVHMYPVSKSAKSSIAKDTWVQFRGYAVDFRTRRPCEELKVAVGDVLIPATMGIFRKDIVTRFHRDSFNGCGFIAVCDPNVIGAGVHKVSLKMRFPGQTSFVDSGQLASLIVE